MPFRLELRRAEIVFFSQFVEPIALVVTDEGLAPIERYAVLDAGDKLGFPIREVVIFQLIAQSFDILDFGSHRSARLFEGFEDAHDSSIDEAG